MRILKMNLQKSAVFFFLISALGSYAQSSEVTVVQDPKFEQLLNEKRKINATITVNDKYKVQIFYGNNENARKALAEYKKEFDNGDGTIVFESPNYKVWVGNYRSRLEAERNLVEIRKKYPYALLIKPNK